MLPVSIGIAKGGRGVGVSERDCQDTDVSARLGFISCLPCLYVFQHHCKTHNICVISFSLCFIVCSVVLL